MKTSKLYLDLELSRIVGYVLGEHDWPSSAGKKVVVTSAHNIPPILQAGPMCGLVGIAMAGQLLQGRERKVTAEDALDMEGKLHPENILSYAKQEGLTKQGEMFSAHTMNKIVTDHLHWQAKVLDIASEEWSLEEMLIDILLGQTAVLVPYDADRNHSPCLAGGHRAHWCLLVGVCVVLDCIGSLQPTTLEILKHCHPSPSYSAHYTIRPEDFAHHLKACFKQHPIKRFLDDNLIYIFARQGKSVHLGLWSLRDLIESNGNLQEVDPRRSNPLEYVIPDGGLSKGLKNKILLVKE